MRVALEGVLMAKKHKSSDDVLGLGEIVSRIASGKMTLDDLPPPTEHDAAEIHALKSCMFDSIEQQVEKCTHGVEHIFSEHVRDIRRAKDIVKMVDSNDYVCNVLSAIDEDINRRGALNPSQILNLIVEAEKVDKKNLALLMARKGGKNKLGHKSDIRLALEGVTNRLNDCSYQAVRKYLNNDTNHEYVTEVTISSCDLPSKTNAGGCLEYVDAKGKTHQLKYSGIEKHLRNIRKNKDQ